MWSTTFNEKCELSSLEFRKTRLEEEVNEIEQSIHKKKEFEEKIDDEEYFLKYLSHYCSEDYIFLEKTKRLEEDENHGLVRELSKKESDSLNEQLNKIRTNRNEIDPEKNTLEEYRILENIASIKTGLELDHIQGERELLRRKMAAAYIELQSMPGDWETYERTKQAFCIFWARQAKILDQKYIEISCQLSIERLNLRKACCKNRLNYIKTRLQFYSQLQLPEGNTKKNCHREKPRPRHVPTKNDRLGDMVYRTPLIFSMQSREKYESQKKNPTSVEANNFPLDIFDPEPEPKPKVVKIWQPKPPEGSRNINDEIQRSINTRLMRVAAELPAAPSWLVDASAGFGDGVSWGITRYARNWLGINHEVNSTTDAYNVGLALGILTPMQKVSHWIHIGKEFSIPGKPFGILRIAPFGNRTRDLYGELPHYHRRGKLNAKGNPEPGQSKNRHRPWETNKEDKKFRDRF